ncbi:LysR family transcriptional regulator [Kiloniella sp. b19]|uniref:LysR family transcriptional regulator n=1 Tax=Kiloniella sp. GXU_MW_B19 TaxID=3141326 RepID=UPI0031D8DF85
MKGSTFNQLTVFQTIVREGSIRAAARKLEIAPPSVSQALKQLEGHLGLPLFSRTTRRMELTEAGTRLHEQISGPISTLDNALEKVQDLSRTPSGHVRITLPRFAFQMFLRPVYAEFCQRYPDIQLEISVTDEAVDILSEGYDLGIRFGDKIDEGMVARPITPAYREALFASDSYIDHYGLPASPAELQNHKLIQYRYMASNRLAPLKLLDKGHSTTVQMPLALIVNDTDAMVDAAEKGLGIGRIITPMVSEKFRNGFLNPILKDHWYPYPPLYVYFLQNSQKARRVRVLIDFLLEKGKKYRPDDPQETISH